jgi:hypothetical protein
LQQQDSAGPGAGSKTALTPAGDARKTFTAYEGTAGRNERGVERTASCKFVNLNIGMTSFTIIVTLHVISVFVFFSKLQAEELQKEIEARRKRLEYRFTAFL